MLFIKKSVPACAFLLIVSLSFVSLTSLHAMPDGDDSASPAQQEIDELDLLMAVICAGEMGAAESILKNTKPPINLNQKRRNPATGNYSYPLDQAIATPITLKMMEKGCANMAGIVTMLLENGANPNLCWYENMTSLDFALKQLLDFKKRDNFDVLCCVHIVVARQYDRLLEIVRYLYRNNVAAHVYDVPDCLSLKELAYVQGQDLDDISKTVLADEHYLGDLHPSQADDSLSFKEKYHRAFLASMQPAGLPQEVEELVFSYHHYYKDRRLVPEDFGLNMQQQDAAQEGEDGGSQARREEEAAEQNDSSRPPVTQAEPSCECRCVIQ